MGRAQTEAELVEQVALHIDLVDGEGYTPWEITFIGEMDFERTRCAEAGWRFEMTVSQNEKVEQIHSARC